MDWNPKTLLARWLQTRIARWSPLPKPDPYVAFEAHRYFDELTATWGLSFFRDASTGAIEIRQGENPVARYTLPPFEPSADEYPRTEHNDFNGYMQSLLAGNVREWASSHRANRPVAIDFQISGGEKESITLRPETGDVTSTLYRAEIEELFRRRVEQGFPSVSTAILAVAIAHMELELSESMQIGDLASGYLENDALRLIKKADHCFTLGVDEKAHTTIINVPSTRVLVALRDQMKKSMLESIKQQGPFAEFPEAYWRVMGSSLFPVVETRFMSNESFATPDIDLQICHPRELSPSAGNRLDFLVDKSMADAMKMLAPMEMKLGEWRMDEGSSAPHHFYISKTFSPAAAQKTLESRADLLPLIGNQDINVTLELHIIPRNGVAPYINPLPSDTPHIRYDDPRQYLAAILARSVRPGDFMPTAEGYKPSDVIHAYKLIYDYQPDSPRVRCFTYDNHPETQKDARLVRLLSLLKFAEFGTDPRSENINAYDHQSRENREGFVRGILNYSSFRVNLTSMDAQMYLKNMFDVYHLLFAPEQPKRFSYGHESFKLSEDEAQFFDGLFPADRNIKPELRVDLLAKSYPAEFAAHPELLQTIPRNPVLAQAMQGGIWRSALKRPEAKVSGYRA